MSIAPDYIRDTIVAPATPPGAGAIGIVRVSGSDAATICTRIIGGQPEPRVATLADFHGPDGAPLDQGIVLFFPAPHSFTGEDVVELQGHGGPQVVASLVDAAVAYGARRAEPGEFSRRAFLNDKLDLLQAEAIADLIGSGTAQAARAALQSLSGTFSNKVMVLQETLGNIRVHTEAALDFPEEDIDFLVDAALLQKIEQCAAAFDRLLAEAGAGRILRDGLRMVIVGRPNAGKSSLLNVLSGQEAAIVTEIAGTTRDILRERINIDGLSVELVDTAGLRDDPDRIEEEGIRRAREAMAGADAILWIEDALVPQGNETAGAIGDLEPGTDATKPMIRVRNKIDLTGEAPQACSEAATVDGNTVPARVSLSAKTGAGIELLRQEIKHLAGYRDTGEGAFTARRRHLQAIRTAQACFLRGRAALQEAGAGEVLAEELRQAQQALGEVTGQVSSDELLGQIFADFCIGK